MTSHAPSPALSLIDRLGQTDLGQRAVIVHASETWFAALREDRFDFFTKLAAKARTEGHKAFLIRAERKASQRLLEQPHLHILIGPHSPQAPHILHAHPHYIWGFWMLDPMGVHGRAAQAGRVFDPDVIDHHAARYFFNGVSGYMRRENVSKLAQPAPAAAPLDPAYAAIFAQDIDHFKQPQHYISTPEMISAVAEAAKGRRVYLKLHPAGDAGRSADLAAHAARCGVTPSTASVHDLITASERIVTQTSAVGFEALMHEKPVILCGRTDYHHAAWVVEDPVDLPRAVEAAPVALASFPYADYFYWALAMQGFEPAKPEFEARVWALCKTHMPRL